MWYTSYIGSTEVTTVSSIFTCTMSNPGAETGDMTGWHASTTATARGPDVNSPHGGAWMFQGGVIAEAFMHQSIFPGSLHVECGWAAEVLTGVNSAFSYFRLGAWRRSLSGLDDGYLQVLVFNNLNSPTVHGHTPFGAPSVWEEQFVISAGNKRTLPLLTDHDWRPATDGGWIRWHATMERDSGTQNDAYFDDCYTDMYHVHSGPFWDNTYLAGEKQNLGFENQIDGPTGPQTTSLDGWEVKSGGFIVSSQGGFGGDETPILSKWMAKAGNAVSWTNGKYVIDMALEAVPGGTRAHYRAGRGQAWLWPSLFFAANADSDDTMAAWVRTFDANSVEVDARSLTQIRRVNNANRMNNYALEPFKFDPRVQVIEWEIEAELLGGANISSHFDELQMRVVSRPQYHWAYQGTGINSGWNPGFALSISSGHEVNSEAWHTLNNAALPRAQMHMPQADGWVSEVSLLLRHQSVDGTTAWPASAGWEVRLWELNSLNNLNTVVNTTNGWVPVALGSLSTESFEVGADTVAPIWHSISVDSVYVQQISPDHWDAYRPQSGAWSAGAHKSRFALTVNQTAAQSFETGASSAQVAWFASVTREHQPGGVAVAGAGTRFASGISNTGSAFADFGVNLLGDTEPAFPYHDGPMGHQSRIERTATDTYSAHVLVDGKLAMPFIVRGTRTDVLSNFIQLTRAGIPVRAGGTLTYRLNAYIAADTSNDSLDHIPDDATVMGSGQAAGSNSGFIVVNSNTANRGNLFNGDAKLGQMWAEWHFNQPVMATSGDLLWLVVEANSYANTAANQIAWPLAVEAVAVPSPETAYAVHDGTKWDVSSDAIARGEVFFKVGSTTIAVEPPSLIDARSGMNRQYPTDADRIFPIWDFRDSPHV